MFMKNIFSNLILSMAMSVSLSLYPTDEIKTYSIKSYIHMAQYSILGAAITSSITYLLSLNDINSSLSKEQIALSALLGGGVGCFWSSYYTNEECFNSAQRLLKSTNTHTLMNLLKSSARSSDIMQRADYEYSRYTYPRLNMMNSLERLFAALVKNQYYLEQSVQDELDEGNEYLVHKGSEYLKTIHEYIDIIVSKMPALKNDLVYLAQLSAQKATDAEQAARNAEIQALINGLR